MRSHASMAKRNLDADAMQIIRLLMEPAWGVTMPGTLWLAHKTLDSFYPAQVDVQSRSYCRCYNPTPSCALTSS